MKSLALVVGLALSQAAAPPTPATEAPSAQPTPPSAAPAPGSQGAAQTPAGPAAASPLPGAGKPEAGPGAPAPQVSGLPVLTLGTALREAQERNLDLQAARARLTQSQEISAKVWAAYLPQINGAASYTLNEIEAKFSLPTGYWLRDVPFFPPGVPNPNGPPFDPANPTNPPGLPSNTVLFPSGFQEITIQKKHQFGAQLSVSQALIAPALWPAIRNAYLAEKVAELSVENVRRELLFGIAQAYYGAASLRETVKVQHQLLANLREHERDAQVRLEAGAVPRILLVRAQIDRARAEQDVERAENAYASARIALATLLDREPDFEVASPEAPPVPVPESPGEDSLSKRPDLQAAAASKDLAERTRAATWYKYAPSIGANWTWRIANVAGFTTKKDSWALSVGLNWTFWDGGLRESEARENAAKVVEARVAERGARNRARDELRRALLDLESARANRTKAEEQLKLARENMRLVNVNYENGVATSLEVSDANAALAGAELGFLAETLNAQLSELRLAKAAGMFDPPRP